MRCSYRKGPFAFDRRHGNRKQLKNSSDAPGDISGVGAAALRARQHDAVSGEGRLSPVSHGGDDHLQRPLQNQGDVLSCDALTPPLQEPSIIFPHLKVYQHVCTYRELHYRTVQLPDCPAGVDPSVSYPEALSCHCNLCVTNMADCIRHEHREPDVCDNDLTFHV
ncbi:hypothetical protein F2P81_020628 [Scophthalmus maximus]|uniref:Glycoprotein hormone subunit beta domain-containing protein n=1 Tax=Scophthalmus maximus TaxID=52904 RepID=A0A6A4S4C0_SCOMX|nr:hypothetical protein F2P81_020628 [Scophthalmus maximus]